MTTTKKNTRKLLSRLLFIAAIGMLFAGLAVARSQYYANKAADRQAARQQYAANSGLATGGTPATTKPEPSAFDAYRVPALNPRYLFIPKLSVRAMVKPLGLTRDNHLAAPANVFDAGWYDQSAKPGGPGVMVLDGHVSSWTARGVFHDLKNLRAGDSIQVERGDGVAVDYKVVKSEVYDANAVDMSAVLAPVIAGKQGLNLITCDGSVVKGTNDFNKRLVVFTEQL